MNLQKAIRQLELKLGTVIKPAPPTGSGELTLASGSGCFNSSS